MKAIVVIDIPNATVEQMKGTLDAWEGGRLVVDEAYLSSSEEDDSFYTFECLTMLDDEQCVDDEFLQNVIEELADEA